MKLLSIIVPSYNMEKYLPKCLSSVCDAGEKTVGGESGWTADLLDVIVVNDGSKDRTGEIAHDFERRYPGVVRVIDKPNGNYGSCINAALPSIASRFVKILDADDTFDTREFAQYLKAIAASPADVDMIMSDYVQTDEAGLVVRRIEYPFADGARLTPEDLVAHKADMAMHAVCYRTELLREISYSQTEGISYTDTEWVYLPAAASKVVWFVRNPIYRYLVGRSGQTMEQSVWVRNRAMLEKVADRMFSQYDQLLGDVRFSRRYAEFQLCRIVGLIVTIYAYSVPLSESARFFRNLRGLKKRYPFLTEAMIDFVVFFNTPFRWYFVNSILRCPCLGAPVLSVVRVYHNLRKKN